MAVFCHRCAAKTPGDSRFCQDCGAAISAEDSMPVSTVEPSPGIPGRTKDTVKAAAIYRKAAERGDASAQFNLAIMYDHGWGVHQDYSQSAVWYRKAAEQGFAAAQYNLGVAYCEEQGVPQDYAQASAWYRKAAVQGDATAQFSLGAAYYDGRGVPQDYEEAYFWINLAASGKSENIKVEEIDGLRAGAASHLTSEILCRAQERVRKVTEAHVVDPTPQLASAFVDRSNRAVYILPPKQVRKLRKFWSTFLWAVIWLPVSILGLPFIPIGFLATLPFGFCLVKLIEILTESYSGNVRQAHCPNCERPVNFWVSTGFPCPYCRHLLMQNGNRLFDTTR
jgi:hypothetical protein